MGNLELVPLEKLSPFRKIAIGTWRMAYDSQVYGTLEVRMDEALRYIAEFRAKTGMRLTVSHLMARATAAALASCPDANAVLRWSRIYLRKNIGVFFQVATTDDKTGKVDLSGATLYDVEKKSLQDICRELEAKAEAVRNKKDKAFEGARNTFRLIPCALVGPLLRLLSFLTVTLNLDLSFLGLPKDPFGSVMITNVGSLGLDTAYPPLVPYSRVPLLLATGVVKEKPLAENGKVIVGRTMTINATFDHRFVDGVHAAQMSGVLREWMEKPFEHFDRLEETPAQPAAKIA